MPNKTYKGKKEALLLTQESVVIVNQIKESAEKRGDGKLFSWKETKLPNMIMQRAERKLGTKITGRGLHGFRRANPEKLCETDMNTF